MQGMFGEERRSRRRARHLLAGLAVFSTFLAVGAACSVVAAADVAAGEESTTGATEVTAGRQLELDLSPYQTLLQARAELAAGDPEAVRNRLDELLSADPYFLPGVMAAVRLDVRSHPSHLPSDVDLALRAVRSDFNAQALAFSRLVWWIVGTMLLGVSMIVLLHAASGLGALHHLVFERLSPASDERFARVAAGTILALPFVWGVGPLAGGLALMALGGQQDQRRTRFLLVLGIATLIGGGVIASVLPAHVDPPDFRDAALTMALAEHGQLTPELEARLEDLGERWSAAELVRGIGLQCAGRKQSARALLERYAARVGEDPVALVALGNLELGSDRPQDAARLYRRALAMEPERLDATYNLALAAAAMMHFDESNRLLARVAEHDFAGLQRARLRKDDRTVPMQPRLPVDRLWRVFRAERRGMGATMPAFLRVFLPWQGGPLWPLALLLIGGASILNRVLWKSLKVFPCSICSRLVCRRCVHRARSRIFCQSCAADVNELPSGELMRILIAERRRRLERRFRWRTAISQVLVPGLGLLRNGRAGLAATGLSLTAAGLMMIAIPRNVTPLPPTADLFGWGLSDLLAVTLVLASIAGTIVLGFSMQHRDLDRGVRGYLMPVAGSESELPLRTGTDD